MSTGRAGMQAAGPESVSSGPSSSGPVDGVALWDEIREIDRVLGQTRDREVRAELAWRRAAAWEQLTILAIDGGDPPWYAAACACIAEVATGAAERVEARRRPGFL
jgi:hypothetical protein